LPLHFLNFFPEAHGHGWLRPILEGGWSGCAGRSYTNRIDICVDPFAPIVGDRNDTVRDEFGHIFHDAIFLVRQQDEQGFAVLVTAEREDREQKLAVAASWRPFLVVNDVRKRTMARKSVGDIFRGTNLVRIEIKSSFLTQKTDCRLEWPDKLSYSSLL
jgi:hypothetical protein